ncbi:hypothetical protein CAL14_12370 [Bordetella genomosp. 9]|nr:hypothetical protein CAL14_12370 [Bordetella genomosp. 9]
MRPHFYEHEAVGRWGCAPVAFQPGRYRAACRLFRVPLFADRRGSGAMRSQAASDWWSVQGEWAEAPNARRGGFSGVQRVVLRESGDCFYVKKQRNHVFRSLRYPSGRPTLLREWLSLRACARIGVPTPPVEFFDMHKAKDGWHAVLVTRGLQGYVSLKEGFGDRGWTAAQRIEALRAVAQALVSLHLARRKHGHLYPKEIFVDLSTSPPAVAFVDWEMSRKCLTPAQAARSDVRRLLKSLCALGATTEEIEILLAEYRARGIALRLPAGLAQVASRSGVPIPRQ